MRGAGGHAREPVSYAGHGSRVVAAGEGNATREVARAVYEPDLIYWLRPG